MLGRFFLVSLLVISFLMFFEVSMSSIYEEIVLYTLEVNHHSKKGWFLLDDDKLPTKIMAKLGVSKLSKKGGGWTSRVYDNLEKSPPPR